MFRKLALGLSALTLPVVSMAAAVPVTTTDVVAQLGEINTAIAAIGTALLVAAGIAVAFKWGKAAVFG
jgi:hypothetical protein